MTEFIRSGVRNPHVGQISMENRFGSSINHAPQDKHLFWFCMPPPLLTLYAPQAAHP
jgi:hypothetical protein